MNNLLSSGFSRLKRDKIFWISLAVMLAYSVIYMWNGCRQALANEMSEYYSLDYYYFHYGLLIGLFCSVFTGVFLGTEYHDGTIRNKLIVGHTRTAFYLSNLLISFTASLLMMFTWLIGGLTGIPVLGPWRMGPMLLLYLLISILFVAAFCSVFTMIGMLTSYKAISQVISILTFFVLLLCGSMLYQALLQPETSNHIIMTIDGMQMTDPMPNPAYVSGIRRKIYEFLVDFLPTGQGVQLFDLSIQHPLRMIFSSLAIAVGTTAAGILLFRKKDLN